MAKSEEPKAESPKRSGLKCPLCGSWYSLASGVYQAGDKCGNESMKGKNPQECSPEHPCPGILEPA